MAAVTVTRGDIREEDAENGLFSCRVYFYARDVEAISAYGGYLTLGTGAVARKPAVKYAERLEEARTLEAAKPPAQTVAAAGIPPAEQKSRAEVELEKLIHDPLFQEWARKTFPTNHTMPGDAVAMARQFVGLNLVDTANTPLGRAAVFERVLSAYKNALLDGIANV